MFYVYHPKTIETEPTNIWDLSFQAPHPKQQTPRSNPYGDVNNYLSNISSFKIIESTLREGEQFANAHFTTGM